MKKAFAIYLVSVAAVIGGAVAGVNALSSPDYYHTPESFSYNVVALSDCPADDNPEEWDNCYIEDPLDSNSLHVHAGVSFTAYTVKTDGRNQWDNPYLFIDGGETAVILLGK